MLRLGKVYLYNITDYWFCGERIFQVPTGHPACGSPLCGILLAVSTTPMQPMLTGTQEDALLPNKTCTNCQRIVEFHEFFCCGEQDVWTECFFCAKLYVLKVLHCCVYNSAVIWRRSTLRHLSHNAGMPGAVGNNISRCVHFSLTNVSHRWCHNGHVAKFLYLTYTTTTPHWEPCIPARWLWAVTDQLTLGHNPI